MRWPVDPHLYLAFLGVMAMLAVTPGPANLFSLATGVQKGRAAALLGVVGMNTATLVWFAAAAFGLGALVTAFPQAFRLIALAGAVYVGWLGVKSLIAAARARPPAVDAEGAPQPGRIGARSPFVDGFLVQIANPKAVLFFAAVLPPFIDVNRPTAPQMAMFALAAITLDGLTMSAYGLGGAALSRWFADARFRRGFNLVVGLLLLAVAGLIVSRF